MSIKEDIEMLNEIEIEILNTVTKLMTNAKYTPEAVAAVLAKTTYATYKSILSPSDYQQMAECLYDYRMDVRSYREVKKIMDHQIN